MTLTGGLGPTVLYVLWSEVGVGFLLLVLRAYASSRKNGKWRADFVWMSLAFITAFLAGIFITIGVRRGLGNHIADLPLRQVYDVVYWFYVIIYCGTLSIAFSKFAVTALLLDVQQGGQTTKRRYALWIIAATFALTSVLEIFLTAFQCRPITKLWRVLDKGSCPLEGSAHAISYVHAVVGGVTDLILALWPISIVWNLQTSRRVKVNFCVLMAVGIAPAIASFVRIWLLKKLYSTTDPTYEFGLFIISATVEAGSLIILGSIPPLRPLFIRIFYGIPLPSQTYGTNRHSQRPMTTNTKQGTRTQVMSALEAEIEEQDEDGAKPGLDAIVVSHAYKVETDGTASDAALPERFEKSPGGS